MWDFAKRMANAENSQADKPVGIGASVQAGAQTLAMARMAGLALAKKPEADMAKVAVNTEKLVGKSDELIRVFTKYEEGAFR